MKKFYLILLAGFLIVFLIYPKPSSNPNQNIVTRPEITPASSPNPYLISNLQKRTYDTEIQVENQIRTTANFTSSKISFNSDGLKQYALLNTPIGNPPSGGWPVIIVNHGYIDPEIYSTENSYINTSAYYANAGFLVIKPDYRGHDNSEGETNGIVSRISYAIDVLNLIGGIKKLPNINSNRIYMYGHSMGGDVSLRVAEVCPDCVRAMSLWAPAVSDWPESYFYFARKNVDDPKRQARFEKMQLELKSLFTEDQYSQISTMANLNLLKIPVLVHHGTADESVPFAWGQRLVDKFKSESIPHTFYTYPNDNHDLARNWAVALNRDIQFFNESLNISN